eukprot:1763414-Amphidinium_carterae.1
MPALWLECEFPLLVAIPGALVTPAETPPEHWDRTGEIRPGDRLAHVESCQRLSALETHHPDSSSGSLQNTAPTEEDA